jgi:mRNA interferase RelE/StbE
LAYQLLLQPRAVRALSKAPHDMQPRIKAAIAELAQAPRPHGSRKLRGQRDTWRIRVGDWRVVYVPDDTARVVVVTVVGHRREVYE